MALVTEDEAKAMWCPLMRMKGCNAFTDQEGQKDVRSPCIASKCMAWREGIFEHQRNLPAEDRTKAGYCGAFGKPESSQ